MSLLKQDKTKKKRICKKVPKLDTSNKDKKEYKADKIWDKLFTPKRQKVIYQNFIIW